MLFRVCCTIHDCDVWLDLEEGGLMRRLDMHGKVYEIDGGACDLDRDGSCTSDHWTILLVDKRDAVRVQAGH